MYTIIITLRVIFLKIFKKNTQALRNPEVIFVEPQVSAEHSLRNAAVG
jgi:hypothetical protein